MTEIIGMLRNYSLAAYLLLDMSLLWLCSSCARSDVANPNVSSWLLIPENDLYFGEVWAESDFEWQITFINSTKQEILVEDIGTSCRCTNLDRSRFTVSPGKPETVSLTLDFGSRLTSIRNEARDFRVSVTATMRAGDTVASKVWYLKGHVKQALSASIPIAEFSVDPITPQSLPVYTKVSSQVPLEELDVSVGHPGVTADVQILSDNAARLKLGLIKTWFRENRTLYGAGKIHSEASIAAKFKKDTGVGSLVCSIPIRISVEYDVGLSPDVLSFGPLQIGETDNKSVLLKSRSDSKFRVNEINVIGQGVQVTEGMTPNGLEYFDVSKTFVGVGHELEVVEFVVEDQREIPYVVRLKINSVGLQRGP